MDFSKDIFSGEDKQLKHTKEVTLFTESVQNSVSATFSKLRTSGSIIPLARAKEDKARKRGTKISTRPSIDIAG